MTRQSWHFAHMLNTWNCLDPARSVLSHWLVMTLRGLRPFTRGPWVGGWTQDLLQCQACARPLSCGLLPHVAHRILISRENQLVYSYEKCNMWNSCNTTNPDFNNQGFGLSSNLCPPVATVSLQSNAMTHASRSQVLKCAYKLQFMN